jgi:hypothetical protein
VFVAVTLPVSLGCIWAHLDNYVCPELQVHVLRILWMTPIYSVNALVSLVLVYSCKAHLTVYPDTLREGYEAYCILSFFSLLVTWVRLYHGRDIGVLLQERYGEVPVDHLPPCRIQLGRRVWNLVQPWPAEVFVERCKYGVMTYVVATPVCTLLTFVLSITGDMEDDALTLGNPYTYISLVMNASSLWAVYCLILFYVRAHKELEPMRPFGKFFCVKGVVFFTYWQNLGIQIWGHAMGDFLGHSKWECKMSTGQITGALTDFLICVEMLIFAIGHTFAFSPNDFVPSNDPVDGLGVTRGGIPQSSNRMRTTSGKLKAMMQVDDVYSEVTQHARQVVTDSIHGTKRTAEESLGWAQKLILRIFIREEASEQNPLLPRAPPS